MFKKNINKETEKIIKISICAIKNNVSKVESKHLTFKTSVIRVKNYLLIDNKNEIEIIDKFFVHANRISSFELEKPINLTLENSVVIHQLTKKSLMI